MKKKIIAILFVLIVVLFALCVGVVLLGMPKTVYELSFETDITAQKGVAPEKMVYSMEVPKDGDYVMYAKWESNPSGMLMACEIVDESGKSVNVFGAHWLDLTSDVMTLEGGTYTLTLTPLTGLEQWKTYWADFDKTNWDSFTEEPEFGFVEAGDFEFEFEFRLEESRDVKAFVSVVSVGIGVLLFVIVFIAVQRDNSMKQNYDERQELLRGRGAKYGLYTMFFVNMSMFLSEAAGVSLPMSASLALFLSTILGGGVYSVYCVWKDAYFALNQKANFLIVFLMITAVINLIIGIGAFWDGVAIQNNQLTFRSMNLFGGIMLLVICGALILKKVCKDREEE